MQTVLFANGDLGEAVARYLDERGELAALVLHPDERRRWGLDPASLSGPTMTWPVSVADIEVYRADCLLSVLFVSIAAHLPLEPLTELGWRALLFAAALIFVVRPLAVLVSTWRSGLEIRDRAFLMAMAPRLRGLR